MTEKEITNLADIRKFSTACPGEVEPGSPTRAWPPSHPTSTGNAAGRRSSEFYAEEARCEPRQRKQNCFARCTRDPAPSSSRILGTPAPQSCSRPSDSRHSQPPVWVL